MPISRSSISAGLRESIVKRANSRCEYCCLPEISSALSFQIDHIYPVKHGGATSYENLAFSCPLCNRNKGSDIAAIDPLTHELTALFNPRIHNWAEHFEIVDGRVYGKTAIGRVTAIILRFDDPRRIYIVDS
ncbi:MAG: HNH endonuclease signature motif containing protein [Chloroflexota bacterium]|jgi:hypothetical protein